ncbi:synaptic vesicle 2-related protein-like isoform X2 [Acanthaster planci]|uniref:Synaptic vesicle 2-related protein-like isoform X2 n=1 Tax=Acanthaster planci TaxID=133434 RepID=A0A8B7YTF8_ACAPL|nr:synaptic vesicle 2-related protein-like isoform X2 [Acanthaster planci]
MTEGDIPTILPAVMSRSPNDAPSSSSSMYHEVSLSVDDPQLTQSDAEVVIVNRPLMTPAHEELYAQRQREEEEEEEKLDLIDATQRLLPLPESHGLQKVKRSASLTALRDGQQGTLEEVDSDESQPREGVSQEEYTLEDAIEQIGFGRFQIKISVLTGLCWMADAFEIMLLSILAPDLLCRWHLSRWEEAFITTVVFIGYLISSPLWGKFCDKFGRRKGLIFCSVTILYYGLLSAATPNYIWLLIMRGLVGFGIGGASQSVTLYSEFLPGKIRGFCIVFLEIFWVLGVVFEVLLGLIVMPTLGWRYLLLFSAFPLAVFVISCKFFPESAYYYLACGEREKATDILKKVANGNGKPMPQGRLKMDETTSQRGRFADLFATRQTGITTLLLTFIWFVNAFAYYGIVLLSTELLSDNGRCEENADVVEATETCFDDCVTLKTSDYGSLLITTFAEFPGILITLLAIEFLGRKKTMAVQFLVCSVFIFLLSICTSRTGLTVILFAARALISGAFQSLYVYTPEVYPTHVRAIGLGSCSSAARIGAITTPFIAQVLLAGSPVLAFSIYGVTTILCAIACMLLPIETKGKRLLTSVQQLKEELHRQK